MIVPIYASQEHQNTIEPYINMCKQFVQDVSTKTKYNNYIDVVNLILEYHNNYGKATRENNFYDWIMIIPINLSVATNGYFAGIETKKNAAIVRAYKVVLEQNLHDTVGKLDMLKLENE